MKSIDRPRERALRFGAAGIVAIAVCARSPSAADADHLDRPIRIERCAVESRTYLSDPFNSMRANVVTGVTVRLTNLRAQPLTRVTIEVRYAGSTQASTQSGLFAAGRPVERLLPLFGGDPYLGASADCRVTSATFADGFSF